MRVLSYLFFWIYTFISEPGSLTPPRNKDKARLSEMASPGILFNYQNDVKKLSMYYDALDANIRQYIYNLDLKESAV